MTMRDLIIQQRNIESIAFQMYEMAAEYYKDDAGLYSFLRHYMKDEISHYHIMGSALVELEDHQIDDPAITFENSYTNEIKKIAAETTEKINNKTLDIEGLIDCITAIEFSEWNDVFLYIVNTLKAKKREFIESATTVQHHLRHLEHFLESTEYGKQQLEKLRSLPKVWEENILIVEDEPAIASLVEAIVKSEGHIDKVWNGKKALEKLSEKYYKIIISDIDMPVMNGITFYEEAAKIYPDINERFLFFSGMIFEDREKYFEEKGIKYMLKPSSIVAIRNNVMEIMHHFEG